MSRKLTIEEVRSFIEENRYELLSDRYEGNREKLKMRCPEGHIFLMRFNDFKNHGQRCSECKKDKLSKSKRLSYKEVKNFIEEQNCELLSKEYRNNREKLKIRCPEGHIFEVSFNNFKNGKRCPECKKERLKLSHEEVRIFIEKQKYELLSDYYRNNKEKLKMRCPEGHVFQMAFGHFKNLGHRCPECKKNKLNESNRLPYNEVKEFVEKQNYQLLSKKYKNNHTKLKLRCPEGHVFKIRFLSFKNGHRCPECAIKKLQTYADFGKKFEYLCQQAFELIKPHWKYQYTKIKGIRPDFFEEESNTIIDCKLFSWTGFYDIGDLSTKEKYLPHCNKLIFVYLVGNKINDPDAETIPIDYFYNELKRIHREDLIEQFEELKIKLHEFEGKNREAS